MSLLLLSIQFDARQAMVHLTLFHVFLGSVHAINQTNAMGVKRKLGIDDANLIKRSRLNVTISGNS